MTATPWWGEDLLAGPDRDVAVLHGDASLTRARLRAGVEEHAASLAAAGIGHDSVVVLRVRPSFTYLYLLFGLWATGARVVLLDPRLKDVEVDTVVGLCRPTHMVASVDADRSAGFFTTEQRFRIDPLPDGSPATSADCLLMVSSGTTGVPKVVGKTPDILWSEINLTKGVPGYPGPGERFLVLSSLVHAFGLVSCLLHCLNVGTTLVLPVDPRRESVLAAVATHRIDVLVGVPTHYRMLTAVDETVRLPSVRSAIAVGEKLRTPVFDAFGERFGMRLGQIYGMTEVAMITFDPTGEHHPAVGRPLPGVVVDVVAGELWVRAPEWPYRFVVADDRYRDGMLRTFDRAEEDPATGALLLHGRSDSIVAVGGLKADLAEIEEVLRQHDRVVDAVVLYADDIAAYVAASDGVTDGELGAWCRERLADYKVPKRIVVVAELPRTSIGKLSRDPALLRALAR